MYKKLLNIFKKIKNKKLYNEKFIKISVNFLNCLDDDKENIEVKKKILDELKLIFYNNKEEIMKIKLNNIIISKI